MIVETDDGGTVRFKGGDADYTPPAVDLRAEDHWSLVLLRPLTDAGREWIEANVDAGPWQWFGGALACEPRYVAWILEGAEQDGLRVEVA